jgi:hypothetical protein
MRMKVILCLFFGLIARVGLVCGQTPAGADTVRYCCDVILDGGANAYFRTFPAKKGRRDTLSPHPGTYNRWDTLPPFQRVYWRNTFAPQEKRRIGRVGTPPPALTMSIPPVRIMQPDHMSCVIADPALFEPMPVDRRKSADLMPNGVPASGGEQPPGVKRP